MKKHIVQSLSVLSALITLLSFSRAVIAQEVTANTYPEVLIAEILTGSTASAQEEFVEIVNQSARPVELDDLRLEYMAASGTSWTVKARPSGWLWPSGHLTLASQIAITDSQPLSSGLAASGGHLRIVLIEGEDTIELDRVGWGSASDAETTVAPAPIAGSSLKRLIDPDGRFIDSQNNASDFIISTQPVPLSFNLDLSPYCPAVTTDPVEDTVPDDGELPDEVDTNAGDDPLNETEGLPASVDIEYPILSINELLIDPASPASDLEDEFIELFNSNHFDVDLTGYTLQSGSSYQYSYRFGRYLIDAQTYLAVFAIDSELVLSNSGGNVRLLDPDGDVVDALIDYPKAKVGKSWARTAMGSWQWSSLITPHAANQFDEPITPTAAVAASALTKRTVTGSSAVDVGNTATADTTVGSGSPTNELAAVPSSYGVLVAGGAMALLYAGYEYRQDIGNSIRRCREYYRHWRQNRT